MVSWCLLQHLISLDTCGYKPRGLKKDGSMAAHTPPWLCLGIIHWLFWQDDSWVSSAPLQKCDTRAGKNIYPSQLLQLQPLAVWPLKKKLCLHVKCKETTYFWNINVFLLKLFPQRAGNPSMVKRRVTGESGTDSDRNEFLHSSSLCPYGVKQDRQTGKKSLSFSKKTTAIVS